MQSIPFAGQHNINKVEFFSHILTVSISQRFPNSFKVRSYCFITKGRQFPNQHTRTLLYFLQLNMEIPHPTINSTATQDASNPLKCTATLSHTQQYKTLYFFKTWDIYQIFTKTGFAHHTPSILVKRQTRRKAYLLRLGIEM